MSWTVGRYRIEALEARGPYDKSGPPVVVVDNDPPIPLQREMSIRLGKIDARLVVFFYHGIEYTTLFIGDQRIPHTPDEVEQRKAPKDTICAVHTGRAGSYRETAEPAAPAKYICPLCEKLLCRQCVAPDRVTCRACFDALLLAEDRRRGDTRKGRSVLVSVAAILVAAINIAAGLRAGEKGIVGMGAVMLAVGLLKLAVERRRPRLPVNAANDVIKPEEPTSAR